MGKLTMEQYKQKMEKKYGQMIKSIDAKLMDTDSFSRGEMLYDTIGTTDKNDLKYYIFCKWWDSIDWAHDYFLEDEIEEWLEDANVKLDLDKFTFKIDNDGFEYLTVYRGVHEFNQGEEGLSWTTDIEVAKRFANGCGVRFQTKHPNVLTGKVYKNCILAVFNDRNEKEILCNIF